MRFDFSDPNVWGPVILFFILVGGVGLIFFMLLSTSAALKTTAVPDPEPVVVLADGVTPVLHRVACVDKSSGTKRCIAFIQTKVPDTVEATTHIKLLNPGEEVPSE